jgi:predicted nucleic acid-binding protein
VAILIDTSVLIAVELLHGVHRVDAARAARRSARIEGFLTDLPTLPVEMRVARSYARLSAILAASGKPVDSNEMWIAATAVANDLLVLALDGDFDRIPGLRRAPIGEIPRQR